MTQILIVGDCYDEAAEREGKPFVGAQGWLLDNALSSVGINRADCHSTVVFAQRPRPKADLINFCASKAEGIPGLPALVKGKYALASYTQELIRLYKEINRVNPNIIIALGPAASWALCHTSGIKSIRGAFMATHPQAGVSVGVPLQRSYKVLPTYAPKSVQADWSLRPILISDLDKASRNATFPEVIRPTRKIWIEPTLEDIARYEREFILPAERLSIDIETKGDQITCIGFAPSVSSAIVIPFFSYTSDNRNFWPTLRMELEAWRYVKRWCETKPAVMQNGAYDMHRLWRTYGIHCIPAEDTMLLHHSLQPEMEKGLGFLATIYTEEASWKFMSRVDTLKKED